MKNLPITLDQIRDTIRAEGKIIITAFERDLMLIRSDIAESRDSAQKHAEENKKDFAELHNTIQDLVGELDKSTDQKITKHCQEKHSFATS